MRPRCVLQYCIIAFIDIYLRVKLLHDPILFCNLDMINGRYQGGESRDLFRLFCTCIRTGPVRKLFIVSLILNEFSCGEVHMPCLCNQQTNIEVFCAYAL